MVESKVIIKRKDYIKLWDTVKGLNKDMETFRQCRDDRCLNAMENRISIMANLLIED